MKELLKKYQDKISFERAEKGAPFETFYDTETLTPSKDYLDAYEEVKKELPQQSEQFKGIDAKVRQIFAEAFKTKIALVFFNLPSIKTDFDQIYKDLNVCSKALYDFMASKQKKFPRFYFVASADLLDILSNGNNPAKIMKHMPKIF